MNIQRNRGALANAVSRRQAIAGIVVAFGSLSFGSRAMVTARCTSEKFIKKRHCRTDRHSETVNTPQAWSSPAEYLEGSVIRAVETQLPAWVSNRKVVGCIGAALLRRCIPTDVVMPYHLDADLRRLVS